MFGGINMGNALVSHWIEDMKKVDGLFKSLEDYLEDTHVKNEERGPVQNFLESFFVTSEVPGFVKNIKNAYGKDKKIFAKLSDVAGKLGNNNRNYRVLLLYALFSNRSNKTDIMKTIEVTDKKLFESILNKFKNVSFFLSESKYKEYIDGKPIIGDYGNYYDHPDNRTQFVTSTKIANEIIGEMSKKGTLDEQCEYFEDKLGYPQGYFKSHIPMYRIDLNGDAIQKISSYMRDTLKPISMYLPSGAEQGANEFWIPGGYTDGGVPEIVVDGVPNTKKYVKKVFMYEQNKENLIVQKDVTNSHGFVG